MNVSAIIVTLGNVDLDPVFDPLPGEWEVLVWDNGAGVLTRWFKNDGVDELGEQGERFWQYDMSVKQMPVNDLSVYGRYAAIEYASHELIYVQDDDVIVSDPQAIVDEWLSWAFHRHDKDGPIRPSEANDHLVANMPQEFRHDGYTDSCLVGFGACFHRDAPQRAFDKFGVANGNVIEFGDAPMWQRTCDVVFTTLTPRVLVDVPTTNLPWADDRQKNHSGERQVALELARKVRDA